MSKETRTLFISDTHVPYQHPDAFDFLCALHDYYDFNRIAHVGDIVDNHYPSFHELEPGCYGGSEEIERSREELKKLEEVFPKMIISNGNHDILAKRKANSAGIPLEWVSEPNRVYGLKGGWDWQPNHMLKLSNKQTCLLIHSLGANITTNARLFSHCSVQGHHHGTYGIQYFADHNNIRWHMSTGCLIDPKSPAFLYDKKRLTHRPILGCGIEIGGVPYLVPMDLKANGRWTGKLL